MDLATGKSVLNFQFYPDFGARNIFANPVRRGGLYKDMYLYIEIGIEIYRCVCVSVYTSIADPHAYRNISLTTLHSPSPHPPKKQYYAGVEAIGENEVVIGSVGGVILVTPKTGAPAVASKCVAWCLLLCLFFSLWCLVRVCSCAGGVKGQKPPAAHTLQTSVIAISLHIYTHINIYT